MNQHPIRPARVAGLISGLVLSLVLVWSIPAASLPGLGATTEGWFREIDPADGLLAVLRIVVLAGLAYLLAATLLLLASTAVRSSTVNRLAASCTGPAIQRFLRTSVGLGIGTMTSLHSLAAGAAPPPAEDSPEPVPAASAEPTDEETTTLTRVDDPVPAAQSEPGAESTEAPPPLEEEPAIATPAEAEPADPTDWWTVAPGDHLWHIAEETLADHGAAPSPDEVAAYWHTLCEANHDRLVDPDNPDLIMPGQQIALPPVPAPSR
jgi:nucleoid-associated protein YgaU